MVAVFPKPMARRPRLGKELSILVFGKAPTQQALSRCQQALLSLWLCRSFPSASQACGALLQSAGHICFIGNSSTSALHGLLTSFLSTPFLED